MKNKKRSSLNIVWFIIIFTILPFVVFPQAEFYQSGINNPSADTGSPSIYLPLIYNYHPLSNPFGVTIYQINAVNGLDVLAVARTEWTRRDVNWFSIQQSAGEPYTWDPSFDQEIINANNAHIQPVLIIGGTPPWAVKNGSTTCGPVAEDKFIELAQFASDLVRRYGAPPYNVKYWELYNEPDVAGALGCWGDASDTQYFGGLYYGQMLQVVYPMIKAADPLAQVMVGGLLLDCDPTAPPVNKNCLPSKFLEGILVSGAGPAFDGVSFHAYDYYGTGRGMYSNPNWHSAWNTTGPALIAKANYLKSLLTNYGQGQKFLLTSETALFYGPNQWNPLCVASDPAELEVTKAYYLIESYAATVANGIKANIWYSGFGVRCSSLLQVDLNPLPAYYAYQFAAQKLVGAIYIRNVTEYPGVMGYEYMVAGHSLWVLWSLDGNSHNIILASTPIMVNHIGEDGKPVQETNSTTLTIDLSPRFIEFAK